MPKKKKKGKRKAPKLSWSAGDTLTGTASWQGANKGLSWGARLRQLRKAAKSQEPQAPKTRRRPAPE